MSENFLEIFFFTKWLDLLTPELFFELCASQGYIQNFERNSKNNICIGVNIFVKSVNFFISRWIFIKKKLKLSKLECYSLCRKDSFSLIHTTHITIYSFGGTMFTSKVSQIIVKSYILTVKNNDNWTFLIFFVKDIVFPLKLETGLYYLSITITADTPPAQMGCSRRQKWIL